jgi:hypothetical protein
MCGAPSIIMWYRIVSDNVSRLVAARLVHSLMASDPKSPIAMQVRVSLPIAGQSFGFYFIFVLFCSFNLYFSIYTSILKRLQGKLFFFYVCLLVLFCKLSYKFFFSFILVLILYRQLSLKPTVDFAWPFVSHLNVLVGTCTFGVLYIHTDTLINCYLQLLNVWHLPLQVLTVLILVV